ncbi:MaoC/PaaZ C-terminal domain-containing protein [Virgisporangium aurantiacum]|uniref:Dehydrogenase n=1 Tax=Virgisporangium aurantiacum TaxID=175570 RepID=A0A8J4E694_9ACTN|nr:MaoC/PaaZ C-terminal domain-containing protein [Virgisporangium aurantiacum]GIJ63191.1 dehydrogenase [Virgisporangium aurantiacum]
MPLDPTALLNAELPQKWASWDVDRVALYHLGLGAGSTPTDPAELAYLLEPDPRVLPTFAVIPAFDVLHGLNDLDGFDIDPTTLLHGEQEIELYEPIRPVDDVVTTGRVTGVEDKGSGALVIVETLTRRVADGRPCFVNRFSSFIRGAGGFGRTGASAPAPEPPAREPDAVVERATLPQQALLYRLSGDHNRVHADPRFAARAGFPAPILHGLCTYGMGAKAVVDTVLGGDVTAVSAYRARFAGVVYPGETLVVRIWTDPDRILLTMHSKERGTPVMTNAVITTKESS